MACWDRRQRVWFWFVTIYSMVCHHTLCICLFYWRKREEWVRVSFWGNMQTKEGALGFYGPGVSAEVPLIGHLGGALILGRDTDKEGVGGHSVTCLHTRMETQVQDSEPTQEN